MKWFENRQWVLEVGGICLIIISYNEKFAMITDEMYRTVWFPHNFSAHAYMHLPAVALHNIISMRSCSFSTNICGPYVPLEGIGNPFQGTIGPAHISLPAHY